MVISWFASHKTGSCIRRFVISSSMHLGRYLDRSWLVGQTISFWDPCTIQTPFLARHILTLVGPYSFRDLHEIVHFPHHILVSCIARHMHPRSPVCFEHSSWLNHVLFEIFAPSKHPSSSNHSCIYIQSQSSLFQFSISFIMPLKTKGKNREIIVDTSGEVLILKWSYC